MISASKSTLDLNNLKILRPKVRINLTNLNKKFCESPPHAEEVVKILLINYQFYTIENLY